MSERVKTIIAAVLLLGLAALWLSRWSSGGADGATQRPGPRAAGTEAPTQAKKGKQIEADDIPSVLTALSRARDGEVFSRERSLFAYAQSPEELAAIEEARQAAEAKRAADDAERKRVLEEQQKKAAEEAKRAAEAKALADAAQAEYIRLNPPKPVPPKFALEYVGVIGPRNDAYAILRSPDQKLSYAKAGDVIDQKFRIERVAKFVLDLTYTEAQFAGEIGQVQRTFESASTPVRR